MSQTVNSAATPYSSVVLIQSKFPNGITASGSGVVVGRNDVLTASHMVYDTRYGGEAVWTKVISGYTPSDKDGTFGKFTVVGKEYFDNVTTSRSGGEYAFAGDSKANSLGGAEADVALLSFDTPLGDKTGTMNIDFNFTGGQLKVSGYPANEGFRQTLDEGSVYQEGNTPDTYLYTGNVDISPGNSGGPLWYYDSDGQPTVAGIVSTVLFGAALAGHSYWLEDALSDNDYLIGYAEEVVEAVKEQVVASALTLGIGDDYIDNPFDYQSLDLGAGLDKVAFSTMQATDVSLLVSDFSVTVTQNSTGEQVAITNAERLQFSDKTLAFDEDGTAGEAYRLYQAAFDRTPDEGGVGYWTRQLDNNLSLKTVAQNFANSAEFQAKFGESLTDTNFVNALYMNVLDRSADSAGAQYWTNSLANGFGREDLLVAFSESAENKSLTTSAFDDGIWFS